MNKKLIYIIGLIGVLALCLIIGGGLLIMLSQSPVGGALVVVGAALGAGATIYYGVKRNKIRTISDQPSSQSSNQLINNYLNDQAAENKPFVKESDGMAAEAALPFMKWFTNVTSWFSSYLGSENNEDKRTDREMYDEMANAEKNCISLSYEECKRAYEQNDFYKVLGFTTQAMTDEAIKRRVKTLFYELNLNQSHELPREEVTKLAERLEWIKVSRKVLLGEPIDRPEVDQPWQKLRAIRLVRIKGLQEWPIIWRRAKEQDEKLKELDGKLDEVRRARKEETRKHEEETRKHEEETRKREEETYKREAAEQLVQKLKLENEALKRQAAESKAEPEQPEAPSCIIM